MSTPTADINGREHWERRFAGDWCDHGGREQSRAFMDALTLYLPATVSEEVVREELSLLDCGCAMGDGTAVLAERFPQSSVRAFDFSGTAIAAAARRYPGLDFEVADFDDFELSADILVSSHCLEHLPAPITALRRMAAHARRYVVVLVPYLESLPPHPEHVRVVHDATFPLTLDGFEQRYRIELPPIASWNGRQLLLIYGRQGRHAADHPPRIEIAKQPPTVATLDDLRQTEIAIERLARSVESLGAQFGERLEGLERRNRDTDARLARLGQKLRERETQIATLHGDAERALSAFGEQQAEAARLGEALRHQEAQARERESALRTRIDAIQSSRLWRLGHWYWSLRRRFGRQGATASPVVETAPPAPKPEPVEPQIPATFPRLPRRRYDVVVLSIIDWDFRFQRPQQLALQYARHGHRVLYLSTTRFLDGDLPWELVAKDERLAELRLRSRPLDIYGGRLGDGDLAALEATFGDLLERLALADVVCVVQVPFWMPLAERLRTRFGWRLLYDCMDEWSNFPGIGRAVLDLERPLVERADLTVVSAERLHAKHAASAGALALVRNGVDLEHYAKHYGPPAEGAAPGRVIGYFGALASWVDVDLLLRIAERFPDATLVLAGGVFDVDLSAVALHPNVRLLGQRPYAEMPELLWTFDVCIIPFLRNEITAATNPVKLYEYFFSGKPVIAPRLHELEPFAGSCYLADGHDEFLAAIARALDEPADAPQRETRREIARSSSWGQRYRELTGALAPCFPLVSVVVVTHGGLELTRQCLQALLGRETWPRLEVLVVDNLSTDGTREYLAALTDERLRVVFAERNLGFPAANNLALAEVRGDVVLLLNNDTVAPPGMIGRLVRAVADPRVGLACATTNFCGNEARVPASYDSLAAMVALAARRARLHAGAVTDLTVAAMYCVAARRQVLVEVGPLDESFTMGMFEDDDYSMRVTEAGYRVVCVEDAYVHHKGQGAFGKLAPEVYEELFQRNRRLFEGKWRQTWKAHVLRPGIETPLTRIALGQDGPGAWPFDGEDA